MPENKTGNFLTQSSHKMQAHWIVIAGILLIAGCSRGDEREIIVQEKDVPVQLEVGYETGLDTRALEDGSQNVNRVTVLFFQKINEGGSNTDNTNFTLQSTYTLQQDITSFPAQVSNTIATGHTYRAYIVGYNQTDYNNGVGRFGFVSPAGGQTLDKYDIFLNSPTSVPQFFIASCSATQGSTDLGTAFLPTTSDPVKLKGVLQRVVSGISLSITGIPAFVQSISLRAGNMVTAMKITDGNSTQLAAAGTSKTLATLTPVSGNILFENLLLPVWNGNTTPLYLDVKYGSTTQTYQVKVQNTAISTGNNITLIPNTVVKITGTYNNINLGFLISDNINLDDNTWDGLH